MSAAFLGVLVSLLAAGDAAVPEGAVPGSAAAELPAPLTFQFAGCPHDLARDVEELVRADVSWAPGDPPAALAVRCDDPRVTLVLAGDGAPVTERRLDLGATPPRARARTAALVATELILISRRSPPPLLPARRTTAEVAAPEPVAIAQSSVAQQPQQPARNDGGQPVALLAVLGTSLQGVAGEVPMFSGGARARFPLLRSWFDVAADGTALYQRRTNPYGTSHALGGDVAVLGEGRLWFPWGAARVGLGVRAVAARVAGTLGARPMTIPASAWGSAVGPLGRVAVSGARGHAVGEIALEGGWCGPDIVGTAGGGWPIGVGGWWAGVTVAAGWLFL